MGRILCGTAIITFLGCQSAPDDVVVFQDVSVIPRDEERIVTEQTVVITGGHIAKIGPSDQSDPPGGATVVAGAGRFLMPGFAEMHGHLPGPDTPAEEVDRILFLFFLWRTSRT